MTAVDRLLGSGENVESEVWTEEIGPQTPVLASVTCPGFSIMFCFAS